MKIPNTRKKVAKRVLRLPVGQRALMAIQEAVGEVIEEHARLGLPLYISRAGKVVAISAEEARRKYSAACKRDLRKLPKMLAEKIVRATSGGVRRPSPRDSR